MELLHKSPLIDVLLASHLVHVHKKTIFSCNGTILSIEGECQRADLLKLQVATNLLRIHNYSIYL